MNMIMKMLSVIPAVLIGFITVSADHTTNSQDQGFSCKNGGRVVIAGRAQTTREIVKKYCTGNIEKANDALIKRYEGVTIPHWAFVNVESLSD
jgi:hypothetical protein